MIANQEVKGHFEFKYLAGKALESCSVSPMSQVAG